jgi:hypothetical protein
MSQPRVGADPFCEAVSDVEAVAVPAIKNNAATAATYAE